MDSSSGNGTLSHTHKASLSFFFSIYVLSCKDLYSAPRLNWLPFAVISCLVDGHVFALNTEGHVVWKVNNGS